MALAVISSAWPARAQTLPNYVMGGVAEVVAYSKSPFVKENKLKKGSGVFVDHGGCLYTNSHVVLDLSKPEHPLVPHLIVNIATNRAQPAVYTFDGEALFVDEGLDLAYVCPKYANQTKKLFTHFFEQSTKPMFAKHSFGDDIWLLGYPESGEGTITVSPGHLVGFIEKPDVSQWQGTPALSPADLKLYKVDALSGPGISGGVMIDQNQRLVGVPFAGTIAPGAFIFSLSEDVYLEFGKRLEKYMHAQGLVPEKCKLQVSTGYYKLGAKKFYDRQCTLAQDKPMEEELKEMYQAFCGQKIPPSRLIAGMRRVQETHKIGLWSDWLSTVCAGK